MVVRRKRASTSWEDVADWYRSLAGRSGPELVARILYPEVARLAGSVEGKRVLDVGCGPGALVRTLSARGADAVGLDASARMIEIARRDAAESDLERPPEFRVGDAADPAAFEEGAFDLVTIVLALQNMKDPAAVLRNAAGTLRPRGRLVLALNHPCFRIPGATHWGWDPERGVQFRRVDGYATPREVEIQIHPGSDPSQRQPSYHWPLEELFGLLRRSGFRVVDLCEPVSDRRSEGGRAEAENRARAEIPMFLVVLAETVRGRRKRRV